MATDDTPAFNLKAVVQETGLKPDTLRAWERRYGVPEPDRTSGGHRLYSQHDINTLKWLLQRQEEGLSISRAVSLWRGLVDEGKDPLREMPLPGIVQTQTAYSPLELGDTIVELRNSWIDACLNFDEHKAELVMAQAFSYYSPEVVCFELLQKALVEIGNGWYEGTVSVQQEHFASALALRRLDALLAGAPAPTRATRIIVGCPPGDNHTFGVLLITLLLRRRGWDVIYLGANVPTNRLLNTIERTEPALVLFSAQLLDTAATLLDVALYLADLDIPLAYGGFVFSFIPELQTRIPGHYLGNDIARVPEVVEALITNQPDSPAHVPVSDIYQRAHAYFVQQSGMLETRTWQILRSAPIPHKDVKEANESMTRNVTSALKLGDLAYIGANLEWIEGMMINYGIPFEQMQLFLEAYHQAAADTLEGDEGRLVVDWLSRVITIAESAGPSSRFAHIEAKHLNSA
jgi:MerR family transcriptional regulator, light-induced transcriptional regulator